MPPRPTNSTVKLLVSNTTKRHLNITYTPPNPSSTLAKSSTTKKAGQPSTASKPETPKSNREFNTSRVLKAVGDSSTIDFAFFPALNEAPPERPLQVPIIVSNIYRGIKARAFGADTPEENVDKVISYRDPANINLASAASTHITPPSYMSEIEDPNFKGVSANDGQTSGYSSGEKDDSAIGVVKTIWNGLIDDISGKK